MGEKEGGRLSVWQFNYKCIYEEMLCPELPTLLLAQSTSFIANSTAMNRRWASTLPRSRPQNRRVLEREEQGKGSFAFIDLHQVAVNLK